MATGLIEVPSGIASTLAVVSAKGDMPPYSWSAIARVSVPSTGVWSWNSVIGPVEYENTLQGVYLGHSGIEWSLWPYTDVSSGGAKSRPYLRSIDGVVGYKTGNDPGDLDEAKIEQHRNADGTYNWRAIEYCQWRERNGKRIPPRAKSTQRIAILPDSGDPVMISLPGTSIQSFRNLLNSTYAIPGGVVLAIDAQAVAGRAHRIAVPRVVGVLNSGDADRIRELFVDRIAPLLESRVPQPLGGSVVDASSEAVPF